MAMGGEDYYTFCIEQKVFESSSGHSDPVLSGTATSRRRPRR